MECVFLTYFIVLNLWKKRFWYVLRNCLHWSMFKKKKEESHTIRVRHKLCLLVKGTPINSSVSHFLRIWNIHLHLFLFVSVFCMVYVGWFSPPLSIQYAWVLFCILDWILMNVICLNKIYISTENWHSFLDSLVG